MIFKFVIDKFIEIFRDYHNRKQSGNIGGDPTVARLKLEESEKILNQLSNHLNPASGLKSDTLFLLRAYFTQELVALSNIRKRGTIPQAESELDGHVKTCVNIINKTLHYWSLSSLSFSEQKEVESKVQAESIVSVENPEFETDPRAIFEEHLIEFMLTVDIKIEMHKAPKSTANAFYILASSMVSSSTCHLEERLKDDMYDQLIKIQALFTKTDPKSDQSFHILELCIIEALHHETVRRSEFKYATSLLKTFLEKAIAKINALPQVIEKQKILTEKSTQVVKKAESVISYLDILYAGNREVILAAQIDCQKQPTDFAGFSSEDASVPVEQIGSSASSLGNPDPEPKSPPNSPGRKLN